tara:strand:+ start:6519 stop:6779 length:261 start_codon:yes stop_codon:yes gene_type:complete
MKKIKLNEDIIVEEIDGKLIILSLDKGIFFEINESGHEIIKLVNKKIGYKKIIENFKNINGISYKKAKSDIDRFLNLLESKSILSK